MSSPKCYFCFSHFQSAKGRIKICRIRGKGALKYPDLRQSVKPNLLGLKENCFVLFCLFFFSQEEKFRECQGLPAAKGSFSPTLAAFGQMLGHCSCHVGDPQGRELDSLWGHQNLCYPGVWQGHHGGQGDTVSSSRPHLLHILQNAGTIYIILLAFPILIKHSNTHFFQTVPLGEGVHLFKIMRAWVPQAVQQTPLTIMPGFQVFGIVLW